MVIQVTPETWNKVKKTPETDVVAKQGDIINNIGNYLFLYKKDTDLVYCQRCGTTTIPCMRAIYLFALDMMVVQGIPYIQINCRHKRYAFIDRLFPEAIVYKETIYDRDVYRLNMDLVKDNIWDELKKNCKK